MLVECDKSITNIVKSMSEEFPTLTEKTKCSLNCKVTVNSLKVKNYLSYQTVNWKRKNLQDVLDNIVFNLYIHHVALWNLEIVVRDLKKLYQINLICIYFSMSFILKVSILTKKTDQLLLFKTIDFMILKTFKYAQSHKYTFKI